MEQYFTGAIPSPQDDRDYTFNEVGYSTAPFDWSKGFDIEEEIGIIPAKDQQQTSACGGFAWSYLSYVLDPTNREPKAPKFIYAHTRVGQGGSIGRDNCALCTNKGVSSEALCPLPNPLTEASIALKSDITAEAFANALTNKEKAYISVDMNIDAFARAIQNCGGLVAGITGNNNGTWRTKFPKPPVGVSDPFRHWVYFGKAKMIDGKPMVAFLNSWGDNCGEHGWQWVGAEYFPYMWEAWSMVYNPEVVEDNHHMFHVTLKFGSKGEEVRALQEKLQFLGFYPKNLPTDIFFGRLTLSSVKAFQKAKGLIADGIVGNKTNAELNK